MSNERDEGKTKGSLGSIRTYTSSDTCCPNLASTNLA